MFHFFRNNGDYRIKKFVFVSHIQTIVKNKIQNTFFEIFFGGVGEFHIFI